MSVVTVAVFMLVMGVAIAGIWTRDIARGAGFDRSAGLLRARSEPDGALMLPHWVAEYATATALVVGAVALLADAAWAVPVAAAALGATCYTSTTSLGWALAEPSRRPYAAPMGVGLVGGVAGLVVLV